MNECMLFQDQCCWVCVSCREDAYVYNDSCKSCDPGYAPNEDKTNCDKLEALVIDWLSPWALVPLVFSAIGILCTIFTTCVFIRYNRTPVIMASGRELCYVLLSGVLCCYSMSFIILAKPTVETCAVMRVGLGLCLSICYSAIFTKTNRISRIFNRGVKSIKRPVYTSPISQVAIALGKSLLHYLSLLYKSIPLTFTTKLIRSRSVVPIRAPRLYSLTHCYSHFYLDTILIFIINSAYPLFSLFMDTHRY